MKSMKYCIQQILMKPQFMHVFNNSEWMGAHYSFHKVLKFNSFKA